MKSFRSICSQLMTCFEDGRKGLVVFPTPTSTTLLSKNRNSRWRRRFEASSSKMESEEKMLRSETREIFFNPRSKVVAWIALNSLLSMIIKHILSMRERRRRRKKKHFWVMRFRLIRPTRPSFIKGKNSRNVTHKERKEPDF